MCSAHIHILFQLLLDFFSFMLNSMSSFFKNKKPTDSHLCCLDALGYGAIYLARTTP